MMSGFMNGSPPVKPISRTGQRVARDLVEKGGRLGAGDIGEPVVVGARVDIAIAAGDIAEAAGVDPQRAQARQAPRARAVRPWRSSRGR